MTTHSKISRMIDGVLRSTDLSTSCGFLWVDALKVGAGQVQLAQASLSSLLTSIDNSSDSANWAASGAVITVATTNINLKL